MILYLPFFDLAESDLCSEFILFIMENDRLCCLRPETAHEHSRIDFFIESAINPIPTRKLINFMTLIDQFHGVEPSMRRKVITSIVSVASLRSHGKEVADGRMM